MQIISWFLEKYPELVIDMQNTTHHISNSIDEQSPFHQEGSVYTYVLMVFTLTSKRTTLLSLNLLLYYMIFQKLK